MFRAVIVYKPGIHVLREFADRGINLDGTFMKHKYGEVLLVACCKNSDNEIQIVAVAWVSGETKDNWSWFLDFLLRSIEAPAFVISDRDKGLIPAMQVKAGDIPHFFLCSSHDREFQRQVSQCDIEGPSMESGKSLTVASFERRARELKKHNEKAL